MKQEIELQLKIAEKQLEFAYKLNYKFDYNPQGALSIDLLKVKINVLKEELIKYDVKGING